MGGESIHPIGKTIGTAMRGTLSGDAIGTATASFSIIDGEKLTLMNAPMRSYLFKLTTSSHGLVSTAF